mmetsp:Transcript_10245/g.25172  ORF Transcript_10245/g.25172 Transcript_10245/m.25172 type:complete len:214 (+) Transcript_10245:232-873(+)
MYGPISSRRVTHCPMYGPVAVPRHPCLLYGLGPCSLCTCCRALRSSTMATRIARISSSPTGPRPTPAHTTLAPPSGPAIAIVRRTSGLVLWSDAKARSGAWLVPPTYTGRPFQVCSYTAPNTTLCMGPRYGALAGGGGGPEGAAPCAAAPAADAADDDACARAARASCTPRSTSPAMALSRGSPTAARMVPRGASTTMGCTAPRAPHLPGCRV